MEATSLQCPACGGPCSPDRRACAFCGTHLRATRCPHCAELHFLGAKLCSQCGTALRESPLGAATALKCPRDGAALQCARVGDMDLAECATCGGVFLDPATLKGATATRERASAGRAPLPPHPLSAQPSGYIKCPSCDTIMNRMNFGERSGVLIDSCRAHGTWFDAGELTLALQFVADGGLEETIRRQRDRAKHELEKQQLEHAHFRMVMHQEERDRNGWLSEALYEIGRALLEHL